MKIQGGCHCGNITYEAEIDPEKVGICHCSDCQTLSGTAFRTVAFAQARDFAITGEPRIYVKTAESGSRRAQAFCPECGSPIYATTADEEPQVYNIRLGTARQRDELTPRLELWCHSALDWLPDLGTDEKRERQ